MVERLETGLPVEELAQAMWVSTSSVGRWWKRC
ncbi:hypothetical protein ED208_03335 [Stagnimonas aquatica]|uniref:Uncharacterized protein n=1 Tax=Stagnimonas aquatica TaxID=2689987 RepID=A0A3N0VLF1_9GAMM|nr:hypothetical protein ED208_03335 [Stagnimonas aquatica]